MRTRKSGRPKKMVKRLAINLTANIPELLERLKKLRKSTKNVEALDADLLREAMTRGLQNMIAEENDTLADLRGK
jgi:predicted DNA-binding protein